MGWLDKLLGRKQHDHPHEAPEAASMPTTEPPASTGGAGGMAEGSSGTPAEEEGQDTTES
jgi:hypothetical protein